jgi:hypothetical protein
MAKYKVKITEYSEHEVEADGPEEALHKAEDMDYGRHNTKNEITITEINE